MLEEQILKFLEPYKNQPEQGTKEWIEMRMCKVGGSELNLLLKNEAQFVAQKMGFLDGPLNILSCNWGNIFEPTFRDITSNIFSTKIYEATSIPSIEVADKSYSMDGIGVVEFLCDKWNDYDCNYKMKMITLFEYKCTFTREPICGEVYSDYIPQVLSGMADLGIPHICLYMESVFRVCRLEKLAHNSYVENWLHANKSHRSWLFGNGNPYKQLPMCYGFMGLYIKDINLISDDCDDVVYEWIKKGNVDFAKLNDSNKLNCLFKNIKNKNISVWNSEKTYISKEWQRCPWMRSQKKGIADKYVDMDDQVVKFDLWCSENNYTILGILGYKLLDINVVPVEKQVGYTKQYEPQIKSAIDKVKYLKTFAECDRRLEYNKMYNIIDESDVLDDFI